jgi:hypothetical protein
MAQAILIDTVNATIQGSNQRARCRLVSKKGDLELIPVVAGPRRGYSFRPPVQFVPDAPGRIDASLPLYWGRAREKTFQSNHRLGFGAVAAPVRGGAWVRTDACVATLEGTGGAVDVAVVHTVTTELRAPVASVRLLAGDTLATKCVRV